MQKTALNMQYLRSERTGRIFVTLQHCKHRRHFSQFWSFFLSQVTPGPGLERMLYWIDGGRLVAREIVEVLEIVATFCWLVVHPCARVRPSWETVFSDMLYYQPLRYLRLSISKNKWFQKRHALVREKIGEIVIHYRSSSLAALFGIG